MVPCAAVWRARTVVLPPVARAWPQWLASSRAGSAPNGLPLVVEIGLAHILVRTARRYLIASVPPHRDCMMRPIGRVGCNA